MSMERLPLAQVLYRIAATRQGRVPTVILSCDSNNGA
jgi:hypothetical protein